MRALDLTTPPVPGVDDGWPDHRVAPAGAGRRWPVRAGAALVLTGGLLVLTAGPALAAGHLPVTAHGALTGHPLHPLSAPSVLPTEEGGGADVNLRKEASLAGYLSYGLMAATVVWGIFLATGWARRIVRRSAVYGGHLTLAIAAQTFALIHALSYVLQSQTHFSIVETFVPFAGGGELEVAFGIVGLELTIGASVAVTLVHRLNYRRFKKVHIGGTYAGALLSWLHVFTTSAEAKTLGLLGLTIAAILIVTVIFSVLRVLPPSRKDRARFALSPADVTADLAPATR